MLLGKKFVKKKRTHLSYSIPNFHTVHFFFTWYSGSVDGTIRVWRQEISNTQSSSSNSSTPVPFSLSPNRASQRDLEALEDEDQQLSSSSQSAKEENSKKSSWLCEHTVESDGPVVCPLTLFASLIIISSRFFCGRNVQM